VTDPIANLSASDKRKLVDAVVLGFLLRAGIAHTLEPTSSGMTLHIDVEQDTVIPAHLQHVSALH
jgi:hypothetical protein